jgi:hypothetical protein
MKTLIKTGSKVLASLMLMILVMLNLQVGVSEDDESNAMEFMGLTTTVNTLEAQADWCIPPVAIVCAETVGGEYIWGYRYDDDIQIM